MARRIVAKQLGGSSRPKRVKAKPERVERPPFAIEPRVIKTLFVGSRQQLGEWLREAGLSPMENGRSVAWAHNGVVPMFGKQGPIEIVYTDDLGYELTGNDRAAIEYATKLNAIWGESQ